MKSHTYCRVPNCVCCYDEALQLIEEHDPFVYDVAAAAGQIVANVAHTEWFRKQVAKAIQAQSATE